MSLLWKTATDQAEGEYYHGTIRHFEPGDHISPASEHGKSQTFERMSDPDHAYATGHDNAWDYAEKAHNVHFQPGMKIHPRVYKVRPTGPVEKDPEEWPEGVHYDRAPSRGNNSDDVRSKHSFEVVHEMPMPEHMGTPEDWR